MTKWYLWPVGNHSLTRMYLVQVIGEQRERQKIVCSDGEQRNLFSCPRGYKNVKTAIVAIEAHGLRLQVFKENAEGAIVLHRTWENRIRYKKARAGTRKQTVPASQNAS